MRKHSIIAWDLQNNVMLKLRVMLAIIILRGWECLRIMLRQQNGIKKPRSLVTVMQCLILHFAIITVMAFLKTQKQPLSGIKRQRSLVTVMQCTILHFAIITVMVFKKARKQQLSGIKKLRSLVTVLQ